MPPRMGGDLAMGRPHVRLGMSQQAVGRGDEGDVRGDAVVVAARPMPGQ